MSGEQFSTLILLLVGMLASALNAVAGGGTLLAFPVLMGFGASALHANATCSAALWLGGLASAIGYSAHQKKMERHLRMLIVPTLLGSIFGAWALSKTSPELFKLVVPALILLATVLLALQPYLKPKHPSQRIPLWLGLLLQFFIGLYGGYFGAAMGILMLALMGVLIEGDLHEFNAVKAWLAVLVNVVATVIFISQGLVELRPMLALGTGALLGGYLTARNVQKVHPARLRIFVVTFGLLLAAWCTYRAVRG
jgi:uncharacterized membrane protein YfcA